MINCDGKLNDVKVCDDWSKVQKSEKLRGVVPGFTILRACIGDCIEGVWVIWRDEIYNL